MTNNTEKSLKDRAEEIFLRLELAQASYQQHLKLLRATLQPVYSIPIPITTPSESTFQKWHKHRTRKPLPAAPRYRFTLIRVGNRRVWIRKRESTTLPRDRRRNSPRMVKKTQVENFQLVLISIFSAFSLIPFDFFGFIDLSHTLPIYPQRPPPEPPPRTSKKTLQVLCTCRRKVNVDYSTLRWLTVKRLSVLDSPISGLSKFVFTNDLSAAFMRARRRCPACPEAVCVLAQRRSRQLRMLFLSFSSVLVALVKRYRAPTLPSPYPYSFLNYHRRHSPPSSSFCATMTAPMPAVLQAIW
jgi:hypothetical protein